MARDIEVLLGDHELTHGDMLMGDVVRGRLYGKLGAPVIAVLGGISAPRFIADGLSGNKGWWSQLVYAGGAIDLTRYQVLGIDFAPNCDQADVPLTITTADQAARLLALLDHLEIEKLHSIVGTSYGGMIALAFAQNYPKRLHQLCVFGASHRPFPMGVGIRGIQRRIVKMAVEAGQPEQGLKLARELAMTTYRSPEEFSQRFTAVPQKDKPYNCDVGDYLEFQGRRYHEIMAVNRFLALSESIDLHVVDPTKINAPCVLISTRSDQLAPPSEMQALCDALAGPSELHILDSIYGHDSFLKDSALMAPILSDFLKEARRAA